MTVKRRQQKLSRKANPLKKNKLHKMNNNNSNIRDSRDLSLINKKNITTKIKYKETFLMEPNNSNKKVANKEPNSNKNFLPNTQEREK